MNITQQIIKYLVQSPDREAIYEIGGKAVTCRELLGEIACYRDRLQKMGFKTGDRVVLQVPYSTDLVAVTLGVLLTGGIPVLIDPGYGEDIYLCLLYTSPSPRDRS